LTLNIVKDINRVAIFFSIVVVIGISKAISW